MKDNHDKYTVDAFPVSSPRGRPTTSNSAIRKANSAKRSARYRIKQRIIKDISWLLANIPSVKPDAYKLFLNYLTGKGSDLECCCKLYSTGDDVTEKKLLFSELIPVYSTYEQVFILSIEN